MDKVVPVLTGIAAALYWVCAALWTTTYYITAPLRYPLYYIVRFIAILFSPVWYVLRGIGVVVGYAFALIAKLQYLYIFLACAAFIGIIAGCMLHGTSSFLFIILGVDPARDQAIALERERRRQEREQQSRRGYFGGRRANGVRPSGGLHGELTSGSSTAGGRSTSESLLGRALSSLRGGFVMSLWSANPPSYHTQDPGPRVGGGRRVGSGLFSPRGNDMLNDDDFDEEFDQQDERIYRESVMKDWISSSASVGRSGTSTTTKSGTSRSEGKQKKPLISAGGFAEDDMEDPLQEHRDLLDTQWRRIRALNQASSTAAEAAAAKARGSGRRGLLTQTIHEESTESESL